jgi:DHA1 family tetracycline resistance protein-like MFS transporter
MEVAKNGRFFSADRRLWIIALILFINVLGTGLILPLLPFFALNMGASPLIVGFFVSTLPFFAILSGPPLGILSDRFGRKPILLFSLAGTVAGFLLLGVAQTLPLLFLARAIDGVSAGNMSTAKAAIADITPKEERVAKLGITFAAESLGLILGPVLGGLFSQYGFSVSAYIAAAIAMACFLLTLFFFPETREASARSSGKAKLAWFNLEDLLRVFRSSKTQGLILIVFTIQLLIMMMWGTLALYGKALFAFGGKELGYISAFAALVGISAQTGLLPGISRKFREKGIIITALTAMSLGLFLLGVSGQVAILLVGVGIMAGCFNIAMPTVVGLASKISEENEQGNLMGSVSSMINLASMVGPVFGNAVFSLSMRGSYFVAAAIGVAAVCLALINLKTR